MALFFLKPRASGLRFSSYYHGILLQRGFMYEFIIDIGFERLLFVMEVFVVYFNRILFGV